MKPILATLIAALALAGCAGTSRVVPGQAAAPDQMPTFEVRKQCHAAPRCFETVQGAVDAAAAIPETVPVAIRVGAGDFNERVEIRRGNLTMAGAGRDATRLHNDLVAENAGKYHRNNWGTAGSATLTLDGDRIDVRAMTIENSFDYLANDALPGDDPRKIGNSQALAVLLDIHSDRVAFEDVALLGYQDTIFANGARAYFHNGLIAGNVDFIFGNGQLLIEDSELQTRRRAGDDNDHGFQSFLLAPSTPIQQAIGLVVYHSRLTREAGVPDASVALARPWHPTTRFPDGRYADPDAVGQAMFIDCYMDAHIHPDHWASMPGTARDGTKTDIFQPQDSRFYESGSHGPGARHRDIGITWRPELSIDQIRARLFEGWQR